MTDELSVLLGSILTRVTVFGAVVVGMKLVLIGKHLYAVGLLLPLVIVAYLFATDGALLA